MIVEIKNIVVKDRVRQEMGDIDALCASIKEFGIIQPIVLDEHDLRLVAGGRRLAAVQRLGWTELLYGRDFIWRCDELSEISDETRDLRRRGVELEENLRRKELTWQEEVRGKQDLLKIMQSIYGPPKMGAPTRSERLTGTISGFGVNKLSSMLGESNTQTSNDLALAAAIKAAPILAKAPTKEAAKAQMVKLVVAALAQERGENIKAPSFIPQKQLLYKIIVDCRDEKHQVELLNRFAKEGLACRALIS
jgi:ParB family chromosome partitioning protein